MSAHAPSRLVEGGGALVTRLLDANGLERVRRDAFASHAAAEEVHVVDSRDESWRGGSPDRWLESAAGGDPLQQLYHSPAVLALLEEVTELQWARTGDAGTYSYYRRAGHHLGIHRDVEECDLAVITCVHDSSAGNGEGGALCLYPERTGDTIAALRARPDDGAVHVPLEPGESIVLLGGVVPHRVLPIAEGQLRIVAPLCFRPRLARRSWPSPVLSLQPVTVVSARWPKRNVSLVALL